MPPPRLFVYGAVDTAEAMCRAAKLVGWHTIVADARGKFATAERIPSADELIVEWPAEAIA
jgi:xanthine dehydrogenase accessory factor